MSKDPVSRIDAYTKALSKSLSGLSKEDRGEIVAEISAHLHHRSEEGALEEALAALGSPEKCAQGFRDEFTIQTAFDRGGPMRTFGALLSMATKRVVAAFGLLFAGIFLCIALAMFATAVVKLIAPDAIGLWVEQGGVTFAFGSVDAETKAGRNEVLGLWYSPIAVTISVIAFLISQWIGRFFLKLMLGNKRPLPAG